MDFFEQLRAMMSLESANAEPRELPPPQLDSFDLKGIATFMKSDKCKNVIVMTGAGLSTAAGIPDFRSPNTGLYHNLQKYNLDAPESIFSIEFFKNNPKPFYELAKELYPGNFKPTTSHYFIRLLADKGLLQRIYTQNIDTLERMAGMSDDKVVEAHGSFSTAHCIMCKEEYSQDWVKEKVFADEIPKCTVCEGCVKPDIVFFGESLPERFHSSMMEDFPKCDLLIIMGTSLVVHPFAGLIGRVSETCPRLLINREKAGGSSFFNSNGLVFTEEENYRDVFHQDDCDLGCLKLAALMGWKDELVDLVKLEQSKLSVRERPSYAAQACAAPAAPIASSADTSGVAVASDDTTDSKGTDAEASAPKQQLAPEGKSEEAAGADSTSGSKEEETSPP